MFCNIELDEKTFDLITKYMEKCDSEDDVFVIDNNAQVKEIEQHVYRNWMDKHAAVHWVQDYAKNYRIYLNSIKILWAAHVLVHGKDKEFTYTEFVEIQKNYKHVKPVLEKIY